METLLVSDHLLRLPPFSIRSLRPLRFDPLFFPKPLAFSHSRTPRRNPVRISCSNSASSAGTSSDYGGWDDLELLGDSSGPGNIESIRNFFVSLGVSDGKQGFLFLLGFLAALAVSRVKFSSMAIFSISIVVFVVGFSAGVAQVGGAGGSSWDFDEKVGDWRALLKEFEAKMSDLRTGLEESMEQNRLEKSKIRKFFDVIECMRVRIGVAQKALEDPISGNLLIGHDDFDQGAKKLNQKSRHKRRELGAVASNLVEFFGDLLQENFTSLKQPKGKDANKKMELIEQAIPKLESKAPELKETSFASETVAESSTDKSMNNCKVKKPEALGTVEKSSFEKVQTVKLVSDHKHLQNGQKLNHFGDDIKNSTGMLSYDDELDNINTKFHFMSRQESYRKMVFKHKYGLMLQDEIGNAAQLTNPKATEDMGFSKKVEASSLLEQTLKIHDTLDFHSHQCKANKLKDKQASDRSFREQYTCNDSDVKVKSEDQSVRYSMHDMEEGTISSSTVVTDDEEFDQNVKEASKLLKRAREFMIMQADEEAVDSMLYKSARLLSKAVDYKPMSLLAIGQLGNTYLRHGELKLKISRELRALLYKTDSLLNKKQPGSQMKKLDICILSRENVGAALSDVCQECEEFLIEAGRRYRMALEIDGNNVKALYNWGLALSFRAGLIADIGPETALDADKIYMAAIDKFDAIASRSSVYAPDALYRWGIALHQRSYLRRHQSGEKMKLLLQAKSLFEDVLRTQSDNKLVRDALSLCLSELRYKEQ